MTVLPEVLDGPASEVKVKAYLAACTRARLAVAYWGAGAVARLGLKELAAGTSDVQIACDLLSGACNPAEVREMLIQFGSDRVRARDKLHAKVWITDAGCVLGSSNASANGHGHEGDETRRLVEANLAFNAPCAADLNAWESWFEREVWSAAVPITSNLLKQADALWKWRRASCDRPSDGLGTAKGTLLNAFRLDPKRFSDKPFRIYIFEPKDRSDEAEAGIAEAKVEYKATGATGILDAYEKWPLDPGTYILEFHLTLKPHRKVVFGGFWKVLSENSFRQLKNTSLTLCTEVKAFEGLVLGRDRAALRKAALQIVDATDRTDIDWTALQFAHWIAEH